MSKYHSRKTKVDGITFDSRLEARRWCELKLMERAGAISDLQRQVHFELQPSYRKNGKTIRKIEYVADFVYRDNITKRTIIEDTKGMQTPVYKLKKKLFEYKYPEHEIVEVKK